MKYEGYLIDLDGTMYRGNQAIEGAKEFIHYLQANNVAHLFVTNNSTSTRKTVVDKLANFEIYTTENHVLTSAIAAANYIQSNQGGNKVYMIGEAGLESALYDSDLIITDESSDYVVIGLDRGLTYDKLAKACLLVRRGARFLSTNKDAAIPTEEGLVPGNGSITKAVEVSSGVKPTYIGKPENIMMQQAMELLNVPTDKILMVGDNYETDILFGIQANIDTLMVLTGFSRREDVENLNWQPTFIEESLITWMQRKQISITP